MASLHILENWVIILSFRIVVNATQYLYAPERTQNNMTHLTLMGHIVSYDSKTVLWDWSSESFPAVNLSQNSKLFLTLRMVCGVSFLYILKVCLLLF